MAEAKPTYQRRTDPLYAKLRQSDGFLASVMSETGLNPAAAPDDPLEASLRPAAGIAEVRQRPLTQRKQHAYEQRQAARPAAKAAQGVLADALGVEEAGEPSSELASQAKALVAQFTPEEMELVRDALLEREVDELPSYVSADEPDENDEHDGATWEIPDSEWNARLEDASDEDTEEGEEA